ncbi:MBL fold metallo-hydrolase [Paenibacillus sp. 5J-6]|uniref:MBL fold metallo-hydrolase n=1 Tax=Paenibacillus silvestris TaxID=2606219 RepID=A0A6L8VA28_9BACL|nr:MBL fold metallo-hydrolase [Paenibacillus silvestris]MZQ87135.1 MBL fold metallo-hydrolase [Paenibacillus silvestris]
MIQFQNEAVIVYQSALFQTTSTVIQTKEMIILVDPNWLPNEIETIQNYVLSLKGEREIYLLFTHGDFDHIIGYQAFPGAKTIGSLGLHNHPKKDEKLKLIRDFDNENYVIRNYPIVFPELDIVIQEDGQQFHLGETTLTFYLAPGHTADGLMTVVEPLGILIAGDYLSDFELPFIYDSAKAYGDTLDKSSLILEKHNIQLLIPGHGIATWDQNEMKRRVDLAADYLKRLRQSVIANDEAALEALNQEHAFPSSFTEGCHKENVTIMKREYL